MNLRVKLMDWIVSFQKCIQWRLTSNITVFEDRTIREVMTIKWGHKVGPQPRRTGILMRRGKDASDLSPSLSLYTDKKLSEDTAGRWLSASLEESPRQKPMLMTPWSLPSVLQNCEKINFCCMSPTTWGSSLWQLEETKLRRLDMFKTRQLTSGEQGRITHCTNICLLNAYKV